ncbi:201_t:CDS:2 [Paraglomus brasilianum]|uniref:201_t:CDS:1 n=1 Tax=Paraglomus brasilianum TaxID=144538 RepID=A0A9N9A4D8_9GLOM|nr:201_t:CDS:2 [Paraglomus brasilianum]
MAAATAPSLHVAGELTNVLYSDVTARDLEWTLASGSATETQTFYICTDSGHFCFVQMLHSNIGWYPTIQFSARFFGDGINTFKSGNMSNFKLSPDRRSATTDGMKIELNSECTKYTVSLVHANELLISFVFERVDRGFKIGEGKTFFGSDKSTGFVEHKFWPKGKVSGNVFINGKPFDLNGVGLFVHALQGMRPHLIATRWNFVDFHSDEVALSMVEFETTPAYGSVKVNQGSLVVKDKLVGVSVKNAVEFLETELDEETGYHIPREINYTWNGKALESEEAFRVNLKIRPQTLMDKIDVLNEIPYVIKKIVQAMVAKPYIYQWYNEATAEVIIGDKPPIIATGKLFNEATFIY